MLSLDFIRFFYHVAQERSIVKAAEILNIPRSTLGKHIQALELDCGFSLFLRRKSGLELTQKGEQLFRLASQSIGPLEESLRQLQKQKEPERQVLRIITTTGVTHLWLISKMKAFRKLYPTMQIRIHTTNSHVDFSGSGFDVGILPKVIDTQDVSQRKVLTTHLRLYASRDYLEKYGTPKSFEDLVHHQLISFQMTRELHRGPLDWHIDLLGRDVLSPSLRVNSAIGVLHAAKEGLGIAMLAAEMPYLKELGLVRLFDDTTGIDVDVYFVTKKEEYLQGDGLISDLYKALISEEI